MLVKLIHDFKDMKNMNLKCMEYERFVNRRTNCYDYSEIYESTQADFPRLRNSKNRGLKEQLTNLTL